MNILLCSPIRERQYYVVPSVGLGYLATALRKYAFDVRILDCVKEKHTFESFRFYLKSERPDILGFQVFPQDLCSVSECLKIAKEELPRVTTVLGGPFVSGIRGDIFSFFPGADYAFYGEAEAGFTALARYVKQGAGRNDTRGLGAIPGLIFRDSARVAVNNPQFEENLDNLGFPAWDLLRPHEYPPAPHSVLYKRWPIAPLLISRGCPYNCTFCAASSVSGKSIRVRSVKNVMDEIDLLCNKYGIKEFHILDDCFISRQGLVEEFCASLMRKNYKISWCTANGIRLDRINEENLRLMKKAGLYAVRVGIESGSPRILKKMKKGLTRRVIEEKIELINKHKIHIHGYFLIGYPGETKKEIEETIRFALKLKLHTAGFSLCLPLPGSEIYQTLRLENKLKNLDFNKMVTHAVSFTPEGMPPKELKNMQKIAFLRFYSRPKIVLSFLLHIRNMEHLKYILIRLMEIMFTGSRQTHNDVNKKIL